MLSTKTLVNIVMTKCSSRKYGTVVKGLVIYMNTNLLLFLCTASMICDHRLSCLKFIHIAHNKLICFCGLHLIAICFYDIPSIECNARGIELWQGLTVMTRILMEIGTGIDFWEGLSVQIGWGLAQGLKTIVSNTVIHTHFAIESKAPGQ